MFATIHSSASNIVETVVQDKLIKPYEAIYQLSHKANPVGRATWKLEYQDDDTLNFSYRTKSKWLFITDKRQEKSTLELNHYSLTPLSYTSKRSGTGRNKQYNWEYDKKNNIAKDLKNQKSIDTTFPDNFQDKLSFQLQFRLDIMNNPNQTEFKYDVIGNTGKITQYIYHFQGIEELKLPTGTVNALKYKREASGGKRTIFAWFAPEEDYLLVKLKQLKYGKPSFDIQLISITE